MSRLVAVAFVVVLTGCLGSEHFTSCYTHEAGAGPRSLTILVHWLPDGHAVQGACVDVYSGPGFAFGLRTDQVGAATFHVPDALTRVAVYLPIEPGSRRAYSNSTVVNISGSLELQLNLSADGPMSETEE